MGTYTGKCFCGSVEIKVTGESAGMGYCHCGDCRSWSAGPVNAFTLWPIEAVTVESGEENIETTVTPESVEIRKDGTRSTLIGISEYTTNADLAYVNPFEQIKQVKQHLTATR